MLRAFILVGAVLTVYQGYRGFMFQWLLADTNRWTKPQRVFLLCIADAFTYAVCTASGSAALYLAVELSMRQNDQCEIALGASALITFLAVYGILGVTGKLPDLLYRIKLPLLEDRNPRVP